jgi:hypothetical protein
VSKKGKEIEREARDLGRGLEQNKGNPVVVGNAAVWLLGGGLLGVGAYRKYAAGELNWRVAGTWAGVIGLFAVGDWYLSQ